MEDRPNWTRQLHRYSRSASHFVYNGHIYLLDATPRRQEEIETLFSLTSAEQREPPQAAKLLNIPILVFPPNSSNIVNTAELRRQRLMSLQHSLEMQLAVLFNVQGSEALYERAIKLSKYDPVRQTLEAFLRAPLDRITSEELDDLATYLERYQEAPVEALRRMRLPEYGVNVLDSLLVPIRQLAKCYRS